MPKNGPNTYLKSEAQKFDKEHGDNSGHELGAMSGLFQ